MASKEEPPATLEQLCREYPALGAAFKQTDTFSELMKDLPKNLEAGIFYSRLNDHIAWQESNLANLRVERENYQNQIQALNAQITNLLATVNTLTTAVASKTTTTESAPRRKSKDPEKFGRGTKSVSKRQEEYQT